MREVTKIQITAEPLFIRFARAAEFLGIEYKSLSEGKCDTVCLNEYRRHLGGALVLFFEQVRAHADFIALDGSCEGRCKLVAEGIIAQARVRRAA